MDQDRGRNLRKSPGAASPVSPVDFVRDLPEQFLESIVDAMADPLFVKDEQHRWILVNEAFCRFMGHTRQEILGRSDFDYFPRAEAETFWRKDQEVFRAGGVNVNEEPFTDAAGQTHIIVTKKTVFTDSEGRRILVGTIRDITELKQAQEELRRAHDELELRVEQRTRDFEESQEHLRQAQKMQALGQLTGGVAHDFNNLLAVIVGNLELALDYCGETGPQRELLDFALEAAERGATLTQRLLAFSRRQALQPRLTDVCALIEGMGDLLRRTLGESIEVEQSRGPGAACSLVDPAQLETALLNLAINARDAMPGGGRLSIDTSHVELAPDYAERVQVSHGPYVLVEVSDTGTGISPTTLERVFEPFFTTKELGRGSGLGLSMVYGFVRQSKGHVSIASAEGKGTTVKLLLPAHETPPAEADSVRPVRSEAMPTGKGESVLVVEDDVNVRSFTVVLLRGLGYQVHQAASAKEALELATTLPALDLLLTDVVLGGMTGPELADELRRADPTLAVLLMSGYVASSLDAGEAYALLDKPFRRAQLARALRAALETADR